MYLVMEYAIGGDLFDLLVEVRIATCHGQVGCHGIIRAGLFSLDIVFRDLKPENVLIDAKGT